MQISRRRFTASIALSAIAATPRSALSAQSHPSQIATRCWIPQQIDKVNRQFNSRSWHFARDNISSFRIACPNWYAVGGNVNPTGTERGTGGEITVLASIEYPSNEFTRVTWQGASSTQVADGETAFSDEIRITISKGSKFFVRFFVSGAVGVPTAYGVIQDGPRGDSINFEQSGLSDQTMSGIIPNNRGGYGFTPAAIVAQSQSPSVAIIGDSLAYGNFDNFDASGDIGIVARGIGPHFAYINLSSGNDAASQFASNNSRRLALAQYCSTAVIQYGVNDLLRGRSAEQILKDRSAIAAILKDKTLIETTITPLTKSSDYFRSRTNQSLRLNEAQESNRLAVNAAVRRGRPGFAHCADIAAAVEQDGLYREVPNITADGIHLRREGYLMAARSFDPAWMR
jgi:hypothetical protein